MTTLLAPLLRLDRKIILVALASLFLAVTLIRLSVGIYQEKSSAIETKQSTLLAQQKSSRRLPSLKREMARLGREKKRAETFLFQGPNADAITSTVQIRLQTLIAKAGLEPESLRPLGGKSSDSRINTINIKLRLNGTLENFVHLLAAIYRNDKFFLIKNCTIKPDSTKNIKVFMDLTAFYGTQVKAQPPTDKKRRAK